jgi:hypothetical protein
MRSKTVSPSLTQGTQLLQENRNNCFDNLGSGDYFFLFSLKIVTVVPVIPLGIFLNSETMNTWQKVTF